MAAARAAPGGRPPRGFLFLTQEPVPEPLLRRSSRSPLPIWTPVSRDRLFVAKKAHSAAFADLLPGGAPPLQAPPPRLQRRRIRWRWSCLRRLRPRLRPSAQLGATPRSRMSSASAPAAQPAARALARGLEGARWSLRRRRSLRAPLRRRWLGPLSPLWAPVDVSRGPRRRRTGCLLALRQAARWRSQGCWRAVYKVLRRSCGCGRRQRRRVGPYNCSPAGPSRREKDSLGRDDSDALTSTNCRSPWWIAEDYASSRSRRCGDLSESDSESRSMSEACNETCTARTL